MWIALATAFLIAGSAGPVQNPRPTPPAARILVLIGGVEVIRGAAEKPSAVTVGAPSASEALLAAGDRIVLREKASISIQDQSGVLQFMGPGEVGMVSLAHYRWRGDRAMVSAQAGPLQISVADGVIQVGSGTVRLRQDGRGIFVESLNAGHASVMGPAGMSALNPGAGILLQPAGPAAKAEVLPDAPQLLLPGAHMALQTFRFKWRAVSDAASYRMELSRDPLFQEIIYANDSTSPVISDRARSLPVGLLFWRVAARNEAGFEGIPSEARALRVAP